MIKIKENLTSIKTSSTLEINELSIKLENEGREIFKFGFGQSPFPVPEIIVDELKKNAHKKEYLNVSGLYELRKNVAQYQSQKNNYNYKTTNILIGPGSKELIFLTQLVLEGDLILPIPSWVSYDPQAKIVNNSICWINCTADNNWHLDPEKLDETCKSIKSKSKFLILNSPNNPSGTIHPDLKGIAKIARANDLIIISDEIYCELNFNGKYESVSQFYPEGTIISSGISKWCGAGGWRLGTLVFPEELSSVHKAIRSIASETYTSVSAPIQYAAIKAFNHDHSKYLRLSREILNCISNYVYLHLKNEGIICNKPQGGFYMLCDFSTIIKQTNEISNSKSLCNKILNDTGFAMLPGSDFGISPEQLISRIAFVDFNGKKTLEAAEKGITLDEIFVEKYCPKIFKGINILIKWIRDEKTKRI